MTNSWRVGFAVAGAGLWVEIPKGTYASFTATGGSAYIDMGWQTLTYSYTSNYENYFVVIYDILDTMEYGKAYLCRVSGSYS